MRKSKPILLVREKCSSDHDNFYIANPPNSQRACGCYTYSNRAHSMCAESFEEAIGITLEPGESTYIQVIEVPAPRKAAKKPAKTKAKK